MTRSRYALAVAATLLIALGTFLAARAVRPVGQPPAVTANGGATSPGPAPTSAAPSSSPASPAGACSGAYSVVSSWPGGFQGQVVVTNTGPAPLNGWQLGWTFPGGQAVSNLWNGSYTQSGGTVTVTNQSYNGTLAPGASTTVGFTATSAGSSTAPPGVSCR